MWEIFLLTNQHKARPVICGEQVECLEKMRSVEVSTFLDVSNVHSISPKKNRAPGISKSSVPAIVHYYFLYRGVPGSADMIPSASEPVFVLVLYSKTGAMSMYQKGLGMILHFHACVRYIIKYFVAPVLFRHSLVFYALFAQPSPRTSSKKASGRIPPPKFSMSCSNSFSDENRFSISYRLLPTAP